LILNLLKEKENRTGNRHTNFAQIARIESAIPKALINKFIHSVSLALNSEHTAFKTFRMTGTATFTCSKWRLCMASNTVKKKKTERMSAS
jgi:hypothetical protein